MFIIRYLFERALFAYFYLKDGKKDIDINESRESLYIALPALLFSVLGSIVAPFFRTYSDLYGCEYNGKLVVLIVAISTFLLYKYYKYIKLVDVAKEKYDRIPDASRKRRVIYWRLVVVYIISSIPIGLFVTMIIGHFISNS